MKAIGTQPTHLVNSQADQVASTQRTAGCSPPSGHTPGRSPWHAAALRSCGEKTTARAKAQQSVSSSSWDHRSLSRELAPPLPPLPSHVPVLQRGTTVRDTRPAEKVHPENLHVRLLSSQDCPSYPHLLSTAALSSCCFQMGEAFLTLQIVGLCVLGFAQDLFKLRLVTDCCSLMEKSVLNVVQCQHECTRCCKFTLKTQLGGLDGLLSANGSVWLGLWAQKTCTKVARQGCQRAQRQRRSRVACTGLQATCETRSTKRVVTSACRASMADLLNAMSLSWKSSSAIVSRGSFKQDDLSPVIQASASESMRSFC